MLDKDDLKKFIEQETQQMISDTSENLIDRGILDSFSMIKIIDFIGDSGIAPNMEELSPDNFNSIDTMGDMLKKWEKHGNS